MYFPYLRGKQFELLALRELAVLPLDGTKLSPIIEPLKVDTRTILTMIRTIPRQLNIQLIVNPEHGEIKNGNRVIAELVVTLNNAGYTNIIPTFIVSANRDLVLLQTFLREFHFDITGYSLVHLIKLQE